MTPSPLSRLKTILTDSTYSISITPSLPFQEKLKHTAVALMHLTIAAWQTEFVQTSIALTNIIKVFPFACLLLECWYIMFGYCFSASNMLGTFNSTRASNKTPQSGTECRHIRCRSSLYQRAIKDSDSVSRPESSLKTTFKSNNFLCWLKTHLRTSCLGARLEQVPIQRSELNLHQELFTFLFCLTRIARYMNVFKAGKAPSYYIRGDIGLSGDN